MTDQEKHNSDGPSSDTPISQLSGRHVVLTVTGGIAAYKSCYLVRSLVNAGSQVEVIMTKSAAEFVTPLTFATLSGRNVLLSLFPDPPPSEPIHLKPVEWGDILVVAPATANYIGKLACGLADDLASTVAMAFQGPILLAPAMNTKMWLNPVVQRNVGALQERGINFIGPTLGAMGGRSEEFGVGRMVEPDTIFDRIEELLADARWKDRTVIVTSGPTREALDPVRFLSNRSSGRMGDAIARQARLRGAEVILIRGSGALTEPPAGITLLEVETAAEMAACVKEHFEGCDLLVMAAAVSDWTIEKPAATKLKKRDGVPVLELMPVEDILSWACTNRQRQVVVGFALETEHHLDGARQKLAEKGADLIALNDPTREDSLFGGDTVKLTLLPREGAAKELPVLSKLEAADRLLDALDTFLQIK